MIPFRTYKVRKNVIVQFYLTMSFLEHCDIADLFQVLQV